MIRRTIFYLRYAWRNLRRSGHWTAFGVFCVAAGVATVVALRSLGLAISDSLLTNIRQFNHGDINVSTVSSPGPFSFTFQRGADERSVFSLDQLERVRAWAAARGAQITAYAVVNNIQITPVNQSVIGRPQFTSSFLIDPQTFAIAGEIRALEPPGVPLHNLFTGGREVVISKNLADLVRIRVGDPVYVSGTEETFTVRGIVPTETEANINNIFAAFFGFAYFDIRQAETMQLSPLPNTLGVVLPVGTTASDIETAASELLFRVPVRELNTTPWLLERNREVADLIGRFIVAMGLGALLIGGVGIMNTMLVLVGRRTIEIAALKTFGMRPRQVAALFASEALLLGVMGSIVGVSGGLLLSGVVNAYGEAFLQQRLPWRLHPEAVGYGLALGLVVTLVFGVLPVLVAARVRPAIILRPNETHVPRVSFLQSLLALAALVLVLGFVAGQILGPAVAAAAREGLPVADPTMTGIIGVFAALVVLSLLVALLWLLIWLIGYFPPFGSVDLRLALRNLSTRRLRTAVTLLALTAGMFALSSITFLGMGAREVVRFQFSETLGGNIVILPLLPEPVADPLLNLQLSVLQGVESSTRLVFNFAWLYSVNGDPVTAEQLPRGLPLAILSRDTNNAALNSGPLLTGRDLTPEDRGKNVIVLSEQSALESLVALRNLEVPDSLAELNIAVGSRVTLLINGQRIDYEVVGIVGSANSFVPNVASAYLPPAAPGLRNDRSVRVVQIQPDRVDEALLALSRTPLLFAVDVTFVDGLLKRLIDQMSAIPTVVGLLSLLAAAVIMGNTVSLATLERRRQFGILKAIGLKRGRVLRVMLLENTLIGLLGGLIGIGISALGVSIMTALGTGIAIPIPRDAMPIAVGLIFASVLIAWIATFLSARVAVNERVATVLRYE